jgi:hypothetical protein
MTQFEKKALIYLAYQNDNTRLISKKMLDKLIQSKLVYRVGNGFYCTEVGASKAHELTHVCKVLEFKQRNQVKKAA